MRPADPVRPDRPRRGLAGRTRAVGPPGLRLPERRPHRGRRAPPRRSGLRARGALRPPPPRSAPRSAAGVAAPTRRRPRRRTGSQRSPPGCTPGCSRSAQVPRRWAPDSGAEPSALRARRARDRRRDAIPGRQQVTADAAWHERRDILDRAGTESELVGLVTPEEVEPGRAPLRCQVDRLADEHRAEAGPLERRVPARLVVVDTRRIQRSRRARRPGGRRGVRGRGTTSAPTCCARPAASAGPGGRR